MLSDEEREALRNFKSEYETCDHYSSDLIIELDDAEILLNLIEKQSKEIEELKDKNKFYNTAYNLGKTYSNKKWEDKIKAKIEEIKNTGIDVAWEQVNYTIREQDRAKIQVLQSLLEKE